MAREMSARDVRATLKLLLGADFDRSPREAAAAYFLASIAEDSIMERRVLMDMHRRFPYTAT